MTVLEATGGRRGSFVIALCGALVAVHVAVLLFLLTADIFALVKPTPLMVVTALSAAALAGVGLWLSDERFAPGRAHGQGSGQR